MRFLSVFQFEKTKRPLGRFAYLAVQDIFESAIYARSKIGVVS